MARENVEEWANSATESGTTELIEPNIGVVILSNTAIVIGVMIVSPGTAPIFT